MNKWIRNTLIAAMFPALVIANNQNPLEQVDWLLYQGNVKEAEIALKQVKKNDTNRAEHGLLRARIEFANEAMDDAADTLKALIKNHPDNAEMHFWLGRIKGAQAQQASIFSAASYAKEAKEAFLNATKVDPNYVPGHIGLIQYYTNAPSMVGGSIKKAKQVAEKLAKIDPVESTLSFLDIAREESDETRALELIQKIENEHKHYAPALLTAAFYYQQAEEYQKALKLFVRASELPLVDNISKMQQRRFSQSKMAALYQIGRTAVFAEKHMDQGITALTQYIDSPVPRDLPSKDWAKFRLSNLYVLNKQENLAKPILVTLKQNSQEEDLIEEVEDALDEL